MKANKITVLFFFVAICGLNSCKKDNKVNTTVEAKDLLDYYMVSTSKSGQLSVFFFRNDAGDIKMYRDTYSSRRVRSITTPEDGTYVFDVNNDENNVYTFKFTKGANNTVSLKESNFQINKQTENSIAEIRLEKVTSVADFRSGYYIADTRSITALWDYINFRDTDAGIIRIRYNTAPTHNDYPINDETLGSYERPIGWKTKISGQDYMGVVINEWKGEKKPIMLMQHAGQSTVVFPFLKQ